MNSNSFDARTRALLTRILNSVAKKNDFVSQIPNLAFEVGSEMKDE